MQPTVEVRWFYEGDIPETALQQFRSGELSQDQERQPEKRKDLYLYLPSMDSLGIKLRGKDELHENDADKLEIKRRQLEGSIVTFITGVTGHLEHWSKWVFHSEASDSQLSTIITAKDEAWVCVSKERYLRKYEVTSDKKVLAVPLNEWPDNGCNVELTKLTAPDEKVRWTLGLEAFGKANVPIEDILMLSANYFFDVAHLGTLEVEDSYGYPRWLNVLIPPGVKHSV